MFPSGEPEIRFDVNGKSDIYDPRTQTTGFTTNWALLVCDRMTDAKLGLGMDYASEINEPQLIAAANVLRRAGAAGCGRNGSTLQLPLAWGHQRQSSGHARGDDVGLPRAE